MAGRRRRALVTGAGIGIGKGVAEALGAAGYDVAIHFGRSADGAEEAAASIQAAGGRAVLLPADLTVVAECRRVVGQAVSALGGLDLLVNNAGVTRKVPFAELSEETYAEMFDLNMRAYFFCAQAALPHLVESGSGSIINVSSVHGFAGWPGHSAYAATKGAVNAFTRELAVELAAERVRVNCIAPGVIEVPRYFDNPDYTPGKGGSMVPWGRVGLPSDIASTVIFLASEGADFITGQVLYVDGGTTSVMGRPFPPGW